MIFLVENFTQSIFPFSQGKLCPKKINWIKVFNDSIHENQSWLTVVNVCPHNYGNPGNQYQINWNVFGIVPKLPLIELSQLKRAFLKLFLNSNFHWPSLNGKLEIDCFLNAF